MPATAQLASCRPYGIYILLQAHTCCTSLPPQYSRPTVGHMLSVCKHFEPCSCGTPSAGSAAWIFLKRKKLMSDPTDVHVMLPSRSLRVDSNRHGICLCYWDLFLPTSNSFCCVFPISLLRVSSDFICMANLARGASRVVPLWLQFSLTDNV